MCGLCGSVNTARFLAHSSDQAGEGLGSRLCILFVSNPACCQGYALCHFLRLLQSFQSLVTSCSCSIWTLYSLRQPSRSRLGPTKTQCAGSSAKICVQSSLAFSKGRIVAELEEARAEYAGWLCSLGRKSGCSTTRKRMSNPGTA